MFAFILHRLMKWLALLLVLALFGGIFYLDKVGLTEAWRNRVSAEFLKHGVALHLQQLTLDPFRGLVARRVVIVEKDHPGVVLAEIDKIVLDINYADLLHGKLFPHSPHQKMALQGIDLHNASLVLPIDFSNPKSERVRISDFNAQVLMPPDVFSLTSASADCYGIKIVASGMFTHPAAFHLPAGNSHSSQNTLPQQISALTAILKKLHSQGEAPVLTLHFEGDLSAPKSINATASLSGRNIVCERYEFRRIQMALQFAKGELSLQNLAVSDARGALTAAGFYDIASGKLRGALRSSLDLPALFRAFKIQTPLDKITLYSPPEISLSTNSTLGDSPDFQVIGSISLGRFLLAKNLFRSASAQFSIDGARWFLRDGKLTTDNGSLALTAMQTPDDFHAKIESTLNPNLFAALLPARAAKALAEWKFTDSPKISLVVSGPKFSLDDIVANGHLQLGRTILRGVAMNRLASDLHYAKRAITCQNFALQRNEGAASGTFTYDFGKHEVRIENAHTSLNPHEVAVWINPGLAHDLAPYRCVKPPALTFNGVVQFDGGKNTHLEVNVSTPAGMNYTFLKKPLFFSNVKAKLLFTDWRLQISAANGDLFGGTVSGSADLHLQKKNPHHSATILMNDVDFESLSKLYFNYHETHGKLSGAYRFTGRGGDPRAMQGDGEFTLLKGDVFAIPIFGPLSGILNKVAPGLGYNIAHKASATFHIANGELSTNDFDVEGNGFSMLGGGSIFFLDDKMNFAVRISAEGLPGVLLNPVGKFFTYTADGSLSKPNWRPKVLH